MVGAPVRGVNAPVGRPPDACVVERCRLRPPGRRRRAKQSTERSSHVVRRSSPSSVAGKLAAAAALTLVALVFPASALAHRPAADVSCNGADFTWTAFRSGTNTVHWSVTVDGAPFRAGATQIGETGSLHVPFTLNDSHVVEAFSWWSSNETADGNARSPKSPPIAHEKLVCPAPAPPPSPAPPPPAAPAPPAATPVAAPTPPSAGVAGTRVASATARLSAQRRCATRRTRLTVTGRSIRRLTVYVRGHWVRTVRVRSTQHRVRVSVPLRRSGTARQRLQVRVTFRNGAPMRRLDATARRCARAAVQPQFTG